jgi:hypothetical protein
VDKSRNKPGDEEHGTDNNLDLFTHAENGWAEGLHGMDRFLKNTYEILSPLNELTARMQMTGHEFLNPDRTVQRTTFGEGSGQVSVIVNLGSSDYVCLSRTGGELRIPPLGFLAESPTFVAFYSRNWGGLDYASPPLFTMRSLDNRPLAKSRKIRVFHSFGDERLRIGGNTLSVTREAIIDPKINGL